MRLKTSFSGKVTKFDYYLFIINKIKYSKLGNYENSYLITVKVLIFKKYYGIFRVLSKAKWIWTFNNSIKLKFRIPSQIFTKMVRRWKFGYSEKMKNVTPVKMGKFQYSKSLENQEIDHFQKFFLARKWGRRRSVHPPMLLFPRFVQRRYYRIQSAWNLDFLNFHRNQSYWIKFSENIKF